MTQEPLLMSIADARTALGGISRTTLYRLIRSGKLEGVELGGRSLVTVASVRRASQPASAAVAHA